MAQPLEWRNLGKAGLWPLQPRRPAFSSCQGCGSRPWSGNTATRVAMIEPAESQPGPATTTPTAGPELPADDAVNRLRRLAQLRDSGVITEAEFQAKKDDLLTQI
jgi:Short C-terminal domain